jgi:hypothetical protein
MKQKNIFFAFRSQKQIKQVEKLSRSDEYVAKFFIFFIGRQKQILFFFQNSRSVGVFHTPNIVSVLHIYFSRPFQSAIVELIKRQKSKVIARRRTTDGRTDGRQSDI